MHRSILTITFQNVIQFCAFKEFDSEVRVEYCCNAVTTNWLLIDC